IVLDMGGTISSAQACGLVRTQFLRRQYGDLVPLFREIKDAFDPMDHLNPGKIIGDDPHLMVRSLRPSCAPRTLKDAPPSSAQSPIPPRGRDAAPELGSPKAPVGKDLEGDPAGAPARSPDQSVVQPVLL